MCSATVGQNVQQLAHTIMNIYTFFDADNTDADQGASGGMGQVKEREVDVDSMTEKECPSESGARKEGEGGRERAEERESRYVDEGGISDGKGADPGARDLHTAPSLLKQYFITVPSRWRLAALVAFLKEHAQDKVIVFFSTCDSVDFHTLLFRESMWPQSLYHLEYEDIIATHSAGAKGGSTSASNGDGNGNGNGNGDGNGNRYSTNGDGMDPGQYSTRNGSFGAFKGGGFRDGKETSQTKILPPLAVTNPCNLCNRHPKPSDYTGIGSSGIGSSGEGSTSDLNIYRLHGSMSQEERKEVFAAYHDASRGLLFCTDVAARGLDLPDIHWSVQYDAPCDIDDYVHRCGRTARKGTMGKSLLFLLPSETQFTQLLYTRGLLIEPLSLTKLLEDAVDYAMTTSSHR